MNFDQIETFLTLAKIGSYTTVASQLHVTQPAVTKRITAMEEELDCKLFNIEKNKRLTLTKDGELFFNYANRILSDFYDAKKAIGLRKKPKIEMGFASNLSPGLISELVKGMKTKDIFISARRGPSSHYIVDLTQKNELTLSFVFNPLAVNSLVVEEIAHFKLMFVISRDHPLAEVDEITVDLLSDETSVRHFRNNPLWRNIDGKLKDAANLNNIEVYDFELVKQFVSDNNGFAILPELTIDNFDELNLCVKPFRPIEELTLVLYAVYRKDIVHDHYLYHAVLSAIDQMKSSVDAKLAIERERHLSKK